MSEELPEEVVYAIKKLRQEAAAAGDWIQAKICDTALRGPHEVRDVCLQVTLTTKRVRVLSDEVDRLLDELSDMRKDRDRWAKRNAVLEERLAQIRKVVG